MFATQRALQIQIRTACLVAIRVLLCRHGRVDFRSCFALRLQRGASGTIATTHHCTTAMVAFPLSALTTVDIDGHGASVELPSTCHFPDVPLPHFGQLQDQVRLPFSLGPRSFDLTYLRGLTMEPSDQAIEHVALWETTPSRRDCFLDIWDIETGVPGTLKLS